MEPEPLRYAEFPSPVGRLWIAATAHGLAAIELGGSEADVVASWLRRFRRDVRRDDAAVQPYVAALEAYFAGARTKFHVPIDVLVGTPFQRKVWDALASIPYGETRSYKWLAGQVGQARGFRAVGLANGANPLPIVIPCHRVVNADGRLGGYGGGLDMKRALLRLEGALPSPDRGP
ncbi:MAG TPA: methylated-DNA--[protein]-cysteine S-methyltransferase [Candidatus Thermoplasmatota archaeon]|jgi:O-6-methylguanine DNA methyltransferase|nr:methylated-DNA--[protein]-cysteine S-methyltransferase [Candidatus Thermoplasmatota archaeon]